MKRVLWLLFAALSIVPVSYAQQDIDPADEEQVKQVFDYDRFSGFRTEENCKAFAEKHRDRIVAQALKHVDPNSKVVKAAKPDDKGQLVYKTVVEAITCEPGKGLGKKVHLAINAGLGLIAYTPSALIMVAGSISHFLTRLVRMALGQNPQWSDKDKKIQSVYTAPIRLAVAFISNNRTYVKDAFFPSVKITFIPEQGAAPTPPTDPTQPPTDPKDPQDPPKENPEDPTQPTDPEHPEDPAQPEPEPLPTEPTNP